ncbi:MULTISPECIES: bifunctional diaminohydroxyphosphoribosylaminopyrimidine deaminase/5-amino-6-(5-phosphoribosylamino)uracil reductase RibD [unclassified Polynucleobacter]|uniref:bifunctional diaminohydroxyphosphoribosylaminopyrimidine deaminase/5-amino-6-(5-phosphoribosylamino)uracil reductase RibD n=1 Tax=unclassified Polynucleobacter TaxID=2640945 RepID=UPI0025724D4C|nr:MULTISPECIES: bifunctional diaminohydroxyphosphoribosylaminopyrimidine deaminase/5-amino-6-(5-phosphoribosylamino)uracil reductase RibD [unclassified Polynucleobacter]BEI42096.1 bifunctional diaminohydroxyphosphoribosylaminopyrimidine deaminase/5-amino-6-(5-phosphoribosylamino)uracil reductase RibD [Polynucleobacter sp. HIN10]BEI43874.1 bifunctional diaminohydroxyphosphoribosylaminopyrimidine deaminase/5-amino-6-(5-phosphoribosylamino)uracil reductase RibD [Polynucleobacter sp. HIN11]
MTQFSSLDQQMMAFALDEAKKALYLSNPNPRVGCVITKGEQILGKGFTQQVGSQHAEIEAIANARRLGAGDADFAASTFYVTLEPCSHTGRTPPCCDALIKLSPQRVVIAMQDPNPKVSGQGIASLQKHGIQVDLGLMAHEAALLNPGFIKRMTQGLSYMRMKIASSLDGRTALLNGKSQWITGPAARADGHHWRAQACAILSGVGTVREDDPALTVREVSTQRQPLRVIVDSQLEIPLGAKVLSDANAIIVCANPESGHLQKTQKELAGRGIEVVQLANAKGKVDLPKLLAYLAKEREINEVHVEAGYKLNGSLIRESCVDELLIYQAPCFLGEGLGMANIGSLQELSERSAWKIMEHTLIGDDLRIRAVRP